jgi:hypothetical protein
MVLPRVFSISQRAHLWRGAIEQKVAGNLQLVTIASVIYRAELYLISDFHLLLRVALAVK